jgi:hypothetical protein
VGAILDARRRGFVLPTTLLVMTLLTVMLTAAFILVSAESRATDNSFASSRALALAQAGLQTYLSQDRPLDSTGVSDSLRIVMSRGYADVIAERVRARTSTNRALWLVRSHGWAMDVLAPGQAQAHRVVAQLAQLNDGALPARAGLVALNGVRVIGDGSTNPLSGENFNPSITGCTATTGSAADTFGVSVPTGAYGQTGSPGDYPDGEGTNGVENAGTTTNLYNLTRIDWQQVLNGQFAGDIAMPGGTWPPVLNVDYPTVVAAGNVTLPTSGASYSSQPIRGVLVATGDVTVVDNTHWDGLILAGGRLRLSGTPNYIIHGMVVTGLNVGVGIAVPADTLTRQGSSGGPSTAVLRWSKCYARSALANLASLTPVRGTWLDTWTLY